MNNSTNISDLTNNVNFQPCPDLWQFELFACEMSNHTTMVAELSIAFIVGGVVAFGFYLREKRDRKKEKKKRIEIVLELVQQNLKYCEIYNKTHNDVLISQKLFDKSIDLLKDNVDSFLDVYDSSHTMAFSHQLELFEEVPHGDLSPAHIEAQINALKHFIESIKRWN